MASLRTALYLTVCLSAWIITTAENNLMPKAENVKWFSLDFKTSLTWTSKSPNYTYTVLLSGDESDWSECQYCSQMMELVCDLTNCLVPMNRIYTANVQTEPASMHHNYDPEELPHTYSSDFNPYMESNISAVEFTVQAVNESTVAVNIIDPLTSLHQDGKQLSIRDVLKNHLMYKISYYKSGSTGKRDIVSESSMAEVSLLDAGQSYCFMVAAYIPSRPKSTQRGAWSKQSCISGHMNVLQELSLGAVVGAIFISLTVLIIVVTVTVLCCRCCQRRNKTLQTSQSSAPV